MPIFATRTMDVFHFWDWGVPDRKSCQVRGDSFLGVTGSQLGHGVSGTVLLNLNKGEA